MANKVNGYIKWAGTAIAIGAIIFNTAILWNDVKHLKKDIQEIKQEIKEVRAYLLERD